jgi:hypothetical protein
MRFLSLPAIHFLLKESVLNRLETLRETRLRKTEVFNFEMFGLFR